MKLVKIVAFILGCASCIFAQYSDVRESPFSEPKYYPGGLVNLENYRMSGVIESNIGFAAIIESPSKKWIVKQGDEIEGFVVKLIDPDFAVLMRGKKEAILRFK